MQMGAKSNQEVILDTIDSLRRRKARPDLERICHMVERKYGVSAAEVECELERLVDDEVVYKVEYKGSTSYRNAAKWKQSHLSGNILNSADSSRLLVEAVQELSGGVKADPTSATTSTRRGSSTAGSSSKKQCGPIHIEDIEKHVLARDPDTKLTIKMRLREALEREIFSGRLVKVNVGYALPIPGGEPQMVAETSKKVDRVKKRKVIEIFITLNSEEVLSFACIEQPRCFYLCLCTSGLLPKQLTSLFCFLNWNLFITFIFYDHTAPR